MLQVSSNTLQQVEKFKYLVVVFTSGGRFHEEIDAQIGEVNVVLRELYCSAVANSNKNWLVGLVPRAW